MIITRYYEIGFDPEEKLYIVKSKEAPICPLCNELLSGYDTRKRKVIGHDGKPYYFKLRRFKCLSCNRIHLQLPDVITPEKHYATEVIKQALRGETDSCPADDSTIRRWRSKK